MARLLISKKTKPREFFVSDKDNLVKIKQPRITV